MHLRPDHGGHGGGSSSRFVPGAEATTAFDNINLLSAPRIEQERSFYRFEEASSKQNSDGSSPRDCEPCDGTG